MRQVAADCDVLDPYRPISGSFLEHRDLEEALDLLVVAITAAGYDTCRGGVAIALDPAASGFRNADGTYTIAGATITTDQLTTATRP